ncbi:hypothetical protein [Nesterenkonia sedimenti]|uniref:hypothetical protein n=1 Tax=Nesterenkonia sedimenti TaxID=1463632 RepID=UPI001E64667A|nr:hypothetical protein [Nesterenkonia sedimenti]
MPKTKVVITAETVAFPQDHKLHLVISHLFSGSEDDDGAALPLTGSVGSADVPVIFVIDIPCQV